MKLLRIVFAGIVLMSANYAQSQTADEIIDKHVAAIGGKAVIESIKSQVVEADLSVMGSTLTSKTTILVGKGFRNEANFNGQDIIQVITPTGGWMINPLAGQTDPTPLPEDQVKAAQPALFMASKLYDYKAKGVTIETAGRETIEGANTYKLKVTDKDGKISYYYIDPTTYYVVKQDDHVNVQGQDMVATALFSDYRKTEIGYVIPYTTVRNQGFEMTITVTGVKYNVDVDTKVFEMPK